MKERKAVEAVVARVYKDAVSRKGRLLDSKEQRLLESKVKKAAEAADNQSKRKRRMA
ncbi:MAG: hypothetical protein HY886_07170 [Deltaproteobacteria bacterium]|nr:hypothetical protein [Deltaproteobacteria bacterium]